VTPQYAELLRRYGSPLYVYRLDEVRAAVRELRACLPAEVRLYYSLKANPHPAVVAGTAAVGAYPEISSAGELAAVRAADVPAERCLYTGPAKTEGELRAAVRAGVRLFSVESAADLARLRTAAGPSTVDYLVRLHPGDRPAVAGLRMTGSPSQFGVEPADLKPELLAGAAGFHLFSATNLADPDAVRAELLNNVAVTARVATEAGFTPRVVDLGGGFGAPFAVPGERPHYPDLREALTDALNAAFPGWQRGEPRIAVESGRHLVAAAGTLLTTVMDVKSSGGKEFVVCDAGVNALGGMSGLGRLLPSTQPAGQRAGAAPATLVGPLCTPLDVLSRSARLDRPAVGDVLAVPNVGAYGLTASLVAFLGRPLPTEVVVDGDRVVSARRLTLTETEVV
jgi:diaminopimelate decarboxylase